MPPTSIDGSDVADRSRWLVSLPEKVQVEKHSLQRNHLSGQRQIALLVYRLPTPPLAGGQQQAVLSYREETHHSVPPFCMYRNDDVLEEQLPTRPPFSFVGTKIRDAGRNAAAMTSAH